MKEKNKRSTIVSPETSKAIDEQYLAIFDSLMPVIDSSEENVVSFDDIDESVIITQVG
jgi:hypothetical protein